MTGPPSYPVTGNTSQAAGPPPPVRPRWRTGRDRGPRDRRAGGDGDPAPDRHPWQDTLGPYLPMNAGDTIYTVRPETHMLRPWTGFGVFCLYAAAALAAGFVLIGHRDA